MNAPWNDFTPEDMARFASHYADAMGWIDTPGGMEWKNRIERFGGPTSYKQEELTAVLHALGVVLDTAP